MVKLRETEPKTKNDESKDSSTLNQKIVDKIIKIEREEKVKTSNIIKDTNILKARVEGRQEFEGLDGDKEVESVMIAATPPSKGAKSRKRKREAEELSNLSADAFSENSLRETAPMILARWKSATYKGGSEPRNPVRGDEKGGDPDEFDNRRRLHTPEARHGAQRAGKCGKWMSAKSGSQTSTRLLENK